MSPPGGVGYLRRTLVGSRMKIPAVELHVVMANAERFPSELTGQPRTILGPLVLQGGHAPARYPGENLGTAFAIIDSG